MSGAAWISVINEKWYVGWEKQLGWMYYVHSSSNGIPRYNRVSAPIPPMVRHRTVVWTRFLVKACSYPNKASAVAFVNSYLKRNVDYVLFGYESEQLVHMEEITIK